MNHSFIRSFCRVACALVLVIALPESMLGSGSGICGRTLKGVPNPLGGCTAGVPAGCGGCHGTQGASSIVVTINGPSSIAVGVPTQFNVTVTGGFPTGGGVDIAVSSGNGTLDTIPGSNLKIINGELTHKTAQSVPATFTFTYTPSSAGNVTIYATGKIRIDNGGGFAPWDHAPNKPVQVVAAPNAPSGLSATPASATQVNLAWSDNSSNESVFRIERKTGAGGTYTQIDSVGSNISTYNNVGLMDGTQYFYRVRANNGAGSSAYSNEDDAITTIAVPTGLTATAVSNSQSNLSWTDNSGSESRFRIERKTGAGGTYVQIDSVGSNITSYNNTGLTDGTQYFYRVRANNGTGSSAYSNEDDATTSITAPTGFTATPASKSQINLSWTDNSGSEDGFRIERKTGAGGTYAEIATVGPNVTSYNDIGLADGTQYFYQVRAFNGTGNSAYSNEDDATTSITAPTGFTATPASKSQINLSWTDNSGSEDGFRIERKTGTGGTYAEIATVGPNVTSYNDIGLADGTQYFYQVRAFNGTGNSAYSNEDDATTSITAPTGFTATPASKSQINLSWTDNSGSEDGFRIERKTGTGGTYAEIATVGPNVTSYNDIGLADGTQYYYQVRAFKGTGNSAYSNEDDATTSLTAPTGLTATGVSSSQINLGWTDNSGSEDGFRVERKTGAGGTYAEIANVGSNVSSYDNTGLTDGVMYYYRVYASNGNDSSDFSNEASDTTVMNAPSNLSALAVTSRAVQLNWTDNSGSESGYRIERKTGTGGGFSEIATVGTVTAYVDTGLTMSTLYFYRVRGFNALVTSGYSNEASDTTLVSVGLTGSGVPLQYMMRQNYPNPFNPSTQIQFALPVGGRVSLVIYDLQGREVAMLAEGERPAGNYEVTWDAEDSPSGVYFARITMTQGPGSSVFTQTRKLLLLK